ncbi:hypothetical protein HEK616_04500 [Streptomyces nigrescens]|uniref:Secreted protein n=2 Tax=Streptomyces TaxID=1883 RepID=A0ABM7ZKX5_STRNI|nr:hypothetical protein [Streptomyces nigrescens]MEE4423262.1 hypothetical protein [Streptomyces sp. DSM 41528]BDM66963.1 hypothetical protein HEK616_04500 [Streptomyces nigrescens]
MPRPTATQLAYGSATVFLSTLAMLLLSQTRTGIGVAVIAIAGLGLGLLVAMTAPMPGVSRVVRRHVVRAKSPAAPAPLRAVPSPYDRVPRPRLTETAGAPEARVGEHSR